MSAPKTNALAWTIDGNTALAEYRSPCSDTVHIPRVVRVSGGHGGFSVYASVGGGSIGLEADTLPEAILEAEAKLRERARRDAVEALALLRALGGELSRTCSSCDGPLSASAMREGWLDCIACGASWRAPGGEM